MNRGVVQIASQAITNLFDERVYHSIGAKFVNYDIMDLATGEMFCLAEGTYLQNKTIFAGKGTRKHFKKANKYAERYGGNPSDWQHVKAIGLLSTPDGDRKAELHWSQCDGIGKKDMNLKRWLE